MVGDALIDVRLVARDVDARSIWLQLLASNSSFECVDAQVRWTDTLMILFWNPKRIWQDDMDSKVLPEIHPSDKGI